MVAGRIQQKNKSQQLAGLLVRMSVAAAVLLAITGISIAHRQWVRGQSIIEANSVPSAEAIILPTVAEEPALEIA